MYFWERGEAFNQFSEGRRSALDIIADILNACNNGTTKTRLMNHVGMSSKQMKRYSWILGTNLIVLQKCGSHIKFKISIEGRRFLSAYKKMKALMR